MAFFGLAYVCKAFIGLGIITLVVYPLVMLLFCILLGSPPPWSPQNLPFFWDWFLGTLACVGAWLALCALSFAAMKLGQSLSPDLELWKFCKRMPTPNGKDN
jgi:hypothetical protein